MKNDQQNMNIGIIKNSEVIDKEADLGEHGTMGSMEHVGRGLLPACHLGTCRGPGAGA